MGTDNSELGALLDPWADPEPQLGICMEREGAGRSLLAMGRAGPHLVRKDLDLTMHEGLHLCLYFIKINPGSVCRSCLTLL